jgi:hypothetical protein
MFPGRIFELLIRVFVAAAFIGGGMLAQQWQGFYLAPLVRAPVKRPESIIQEKLPATLYKVA